LNEDSYYLSDAYSLCVCSLFKADDFSGFFLPAI
jgi:hypothetical protein